VLEGVAAPDPSPAIILTTGNFGYTPIIAFAGRAATGMHFVGGMQPAVGPLPNYGWEPLGVQLGLFALGEAAWGGGDAWCSLLCSLGEGAAFRYLRRGATVFAP
jgi:hypothetical protein